MYHGAPYHTTPAHGASSRRRAALMRALAGIASQGPELGADPFGSFQAGLAGALNMGVEQQAQARQAQRDEMQRQWFEAQMGQMRGQRYAPQPWYEAPNVSPTIRDQYRADALYHPERAAAQDWTVPMTTPEGETERAIYPGLENVPAAGREIAFRQMMEQRYAPKPTPRQISPWQARQIRAWIAQHPGASEDDAIAALTYERPVMTGGSTQLRDYNGPVFRDANGKLTYEAFSKGRQNEPVMVPYEHQYGSRYGGGGSDPGGLR